jgi:Integrase core domain
MKQSAGQETICPANGIFFLERHPTPDILIKDPGSSPRRSEMIVCTDSKNLFMRFVIYGRPQYLRTEPDWPCQNGRVERFIGTVKRALATEPIANGRDVTDALRDVRIWYNHDRPHDHLQGKTPAEV